MAGNDSSEEAKMISPMESMVRKLRLFRFPVQSLQHFDTFLYFALCQNVCHDAILD